MVFYFYTIIYSEVVLYLSEFLSSTECKCYFEEQGKPNSCWSSVTSIFSFLAKSMWTSNCLVTQIHQNILFCVQHKKHILGWIIPLMTVGCMFNTVPLRPICRHASVCLSCCVNFHFRHNQLSLYVNLVCLWPISHKFRHHQFG